MTWDALDPVSGYRPTVSAEYAERVRAWHERALSHGQRRGAQERTFDYLGFQIAVPPGVMPITPTSHLLGEAVLSRVRANQRVLDMGTGSGVNAILAAACGADVLAVDVNPVAVEAVRANAARNAVSDRVEVRCSDVFKAVTGRFDWIIFDPPFRWFAARDQTEAATTDQGYRAMTRFFREAHQYLEPGGKMLIFFGTSGDLGYLHDLMAETGFSAETVARDELLKDDWTIEYFRYVVTPSQSPDSP